MLLTVLFFCLVFFCTVQLRPVSCFIKEISDFDFSGPYILRAKNRD